MPRLQELQKSTNISTFKLIHLLINKVICIEYPSFILENAYTPFKMFIRLTK